MFQGSFSCYTCTCLWFWHLFTPHVSYNLYFFFCKSHAVCSYVFCQFFLFFVADSEILWRMICKYPCMSVFIYPMQGLLREIFWFASEPPSPTTYLFSFTIYWPLSPPKPPVLSAPPSQELKKWTSWTLSPHKAGPHGLLSHQNLII